jgi:hypothetical protein
LTVPYRSPPIAGKETTEKETEIAAMIDLYIVFDTPNKKAVAEKKK